MPIMTKAAAGPHRIRLLSTSFHDGFYNMGLDEALLEGLSRTGKPCLRFYGWDPPAVSIGYFQRLEEMVDLKACEDRGFNVVRRVSGGGTVFHWNEITYSLFLPLSHPLARDSITDSFRRICGGIMEGLRILGLSSWFKPVNDVYVGDKKISGNAQVRKAGCLLQHGTVLLETDAELMFGLIRVPPEKREAAGKEGQTKRLTSLRAELGKAVSFEEAEAALAEGFRRALSLDYGFPPPAGVFTGGEAPSPEEDERARTLGTEKFAFPAFLYRR
jgi:lipoate-protein ligase A